MSLLDLYKPLEGSELLAAILNRENAVAFRLIRNGYDIEFVGNDGHNALMCAVMRKSYPIIEFLVLKKANLNKQTTDTGMTAIMLAAMNRDLKAFNILFEAGADIHLLNKKNQSALSYAAKNGSHEMVSMLIQKGANVNQKDDYGYNPLVGAVINQHEKVVELLVQNCANCDNIDNEGGFYLNNAIKLGKVAIAESLVRTGLNIHYFDEHYQSGFDLASNAGYHDLVLEMIKNQSLLGNS
jgi:serine/threonine-protein phosphatase 6 regulatory ankyrin repeat subunit B